MSSLDGTGGIVDTFGVSLLAGSMLNPGAGNITLVGGGDLIVETDIITASGDIQLAAPRDVIIRATVQSGDSFVTLTADQTLGGMPHDGVGGVLIEGNGFVDAATSVTLTGADLFNDGAGNATQESVRIDVDDMGASNAQVQAGGSITLESEATLSPATADIIINGVVNSTGSGTTSVDAAQNTLLGNDVTGTNDVDFNDNVLVTADVLVSGANVDFDLALDDDGNGGTDSNVTINGSGTTTFTGAVGANDALSSLTTDAAGDTQINGGSVDTTGTQAYNDDVTLGANTVLTGTTVSFGDTVDAATAAMQSLQVSGDAVFGDSAGDVVGSNAELSSLTVTGTTTINGGNGSADSILTDGNQDYQDDVILGRNTTLASESAGTINFDGDINGDGTGPWDLLINTQGLTQLDGGMVGNVNELNNLITDDPAAPANQLGGTTELSGIFNTVLDQTFNDAVVLTGNVTNNSSGSGNVSYNSTLDADMTANDRTLAINTAGTTEFNGRVGDTEQLESVTTDAPGTTEINTDIFNVDGASITFNDPVIVEQDLVITEAGTGDVTFNNIVDSESGETNDLTINTTGGGDTVFNGNVGDTDRLDEITTDDNGGDSVIFGTGVMIQSVGNQTYNDAVDANDGNGATVDVTLDAMGADIMAVNAANDFGTAEIIGGNATLVDVNAFEFGDSSVTGNVMLTAGGDVTDFDGATVNIDGLLSINTTGNINLNNAGNDINDLEIVNAGDAIIDNDDANGVALQSINTTGFLQVTSEGPITVETTTTVITVGTTATFITNDDAGSAITIDTLLFTAGGTVTAQALNNAGTAAVDADIRIIELTDTLLIDQIETAGDAFLESAVDLVDGGDANVDITADNVALRSRQGIGDGNELETAISTLAAVNTVSGDIDINNSVGGLLTIGAVDNVSGVTNTGPDDIDITNGSPLTVSNNVTATGDITLTASDSAAAGDDFTVNGNVVIASARWLGHSQCG